MVSIQAVLLIARPFCCRMKPAMPFKERTIYAELLLLDDPLLTQCMRLLWQQLDPSFIGMSWYQSWSQLTAPLPVPSMCVCYADDGRVVVNTELNVASRVYAAGSAAKFPNSVTDHGHVAGEGTVDGRLAGQVAAMHMARNYHGRVGGVIFGRRRHDISMTSFAAESFPVW